MSSYDFRKQPSVLIQGAMDTETAYLIENLREREKISLGNWEFHTGFLGKNSEPVIVSKTYQGMVNAAAAGSLALSFFSPATVINQGIAGGHDSSFHRGDIVIGEKAVPMGAWFRRYAPCGAGIREDDFEPLEIEIFDRKIGKTRKVTEFPCDGKLVSLAERVETHLCARRGVLGSADEWNNQLDRIALLRRRYHTASEDMESAATAELCLSYGVPFIGIRIISNSIVNGEEYDESVGLDGQKFVLKFIEALRGH